SVAEGFPQAPASPRGPLLLPASTERINAPRPADTVLPHEYAFRYVGENVVKGEAPHFTLNVGEGQKAQQRVLTRRDFTFLPQEDQRILSRRGVAVLTTQPGEDSSIMVPIEFPNPIWVLQGHEWIKVNPGDPTLPLDVGTRISLRRITTQDGRSSDRIPLHQVDTSQALEFIWGPRWPQLQGKGSPIQLDPGESLPLGDLTIVRDKEHPIFRIGGGGGKIIEIRSPWTQGNMDWKQHNTANNPVLGEIGETVSIRRVQPEGMEYYHLRLDDRARSSHQLPRVTMELHGQKASAPFRSNSADMPVGRRTFPQLLDQSFVSREHFQLSIVEMQGHPRYLITVKSENGLWLENHFFRKGESIPLYSSRVNLYFPTEANSVDPKSADGPLSLTLPPIERIFPGWNLPNIRPDHNQARRPEPPTIPPHARGSRGRRFWPR
ncbi:MAG: FHA domain-containing protein, partial [bacterium]|nr:FHA domain-containing protein [bacterium]